MDVRRCFHPRTLWTAARVAVVVGTILNLINHGDALLGGGVTWKPAAEMAMNYVVPFLVSAHGQAVSGA